MRIRIGQAWRIGFVVGPLVGLALLSGCGAAGESAGEIGDQAEQIGADSQAVTTKHPLGNKRDSASKLAAMRLTSVPSRAGALPTSVDLSASIPAPGDQLTENSCTAWATSYAAKSYHETVEMKWSPASNAHQFSPGWLYNQINGGSDSGSFISSAMDLIVNKGDDTLADFPYNPNDYTTQPSAASMARASHFKAKSWNSFTVSESNIKNVLAANNVVVVGLEVLPDFDTLNSTSNTVYDSATGASRGRHAVALVGYDDNKKAFKLINSWGTAWGSGGYGWLAYSLVTNPSLAMDAYVMTDAPNTGATGYGVCGFGEPGCERQPTTLHRSVVNCGGGGISLNQTISLANYGNYTCESRFQEQCVNDGSFDAFYMENCDYAGATCTEKGSKHFGCDPGAKPAGTCSPTVLHRKVYSCDGTLTSPETTIDLTKGYSNYTCNNRFTAQCVSDGSFDSYYSEWCEYTCQ